MPGDVGGGSRGHDSTCAGPAAAGARRGRFAPRRSSRGRSPGRHPEPSSTHSKWEPAGRTPRASCRPGHAPRPGHRQRAMPHQLRPTAPVRVVHHDPHLLRPRHEVHGTADSRSTAWHRPVREVARGGDLHSAEHRDVEMTSADDGEGERRIECGAAPMTILAYSLPAFCMSRSISSASGTPPRPRTPFSVWNHTSRSAGMCDAIIIGMPIPRFTYGPSGTSLGGSGRERLSRPTGASRIGRSRSSRRSR